MANNKARSKGKSKYVASLKLMIHQADEGLRRLQWDYMRQCMREARNLSNIGVETAFALDKGLKETGEKKDGSKVSPATQVYRDMCLHRKFLMAGTVAGLGNNVCTMYSNSVKFRQGVPKFRSGTIPTRHQEMNFWSDRTTWQDKGGKTRKGTGYFLMARFCHDMTDEVIQELIDANAKREKHRKKTSGKNYKALPYPASPSDVEGLSRRVVFKGILGKKDTGTAATLDAVVSGVYEMSDSQIVEKNGSLYLKLVWWNPNEDKPTLDPNRVCGIDMGWNIPMVCASSEGWAREFLGSRDEIWAARSRFRSLRRRNQRRKMIAGKSRRESSVSESEKNWIDNYCHNLSKRAIDFCLKNNLGTIHVEDLSSLRAMDGKDHYKRLIWVPCKLQQMLEYKAKSVGIKFVKVNPRNTSRTCSCCGHIDKESRKTQDRFECVECGQKFHADYNAARNIAKIATKSRAGDAEIIADENEFQSVERTPVTDPAVVAAVEESYNEQLVRVHSGVC